MARKTAVRSGSLFRERLAAWWDGAELPIDARPAGKPAPDKLVSTGEIPVDAPPRQKPQSVSDWPAARRKLVQLVFGEGFIAPGRDYTLELIRPFDLSSGMSFLEIGGAMGGAARAIAQLWGVYVASFERDPALADDGADQARYYGMQRQARVSAMPADDPTQIELKPDFYDGALIRDVLPWIADPDALFARTAASLKPGSALVIADMFAGDAPAPPDWSEFEAAPFRPHSLDSIKASLGRARLEVQNIRDVTDEYCLEVRSYWDNFVRRPDRERLGQEVVAPLAAEVERWARLGRAMETRHIKIVQLTAVRPLV